MVANAALNTPTAQRVICRKGRAGARVPAREVPRVEDTVGARRGHLGGHRELRDGRGCHHAHLHAYVVLMMSLDYSVRRCAHNPLYDSEAKSSHLAAHMWAASWAGGHPRTEKAKPAKEMAIGGSSKSMGNLPARVILRSCTPCPVRRLCRPVLTAWQCAHWKGKRWTHSCL